MHVLRLLQAAGITKQPAATLHILPLCELPFLEAILTPTWHLPNERNPQHHHLFPVPVPVRFASPWLAVGSILSVLRALAQACAMSASVRFVACVIVDPCSSTKHNDAEPALKFECYRQPHPPK